MDFFKNCSCFMDSRLLMLYRILLYFCFWQETILHNMTIVSEWKSDKIVGIINDWPFLYPYFCMEIDRIFKNCSCFIDFRLLMLYQIRCSFAFDKRPYCTTWIWYQNENMLKIVGIINDWPFLYLYFCMKIDRIFKNCSCFIDYRFLMLYRILLNFCVWQETILHNMSTLSESKPVKTCRNY